jgi:hypothetical protein
VTRTGFLKANIFITGGLCLAAGALRMMDAPPGAQMGGDAFVLLSPMFFAMAAHRGQRWGRLAVAMGLVGTVFAGGALAAILLGSSGAP